MSVPVNDHRTLQRIDRRIPFLRRQMIQQFFIVISDRIVCRGENIVCVPGDIVLHAVQGLKITGIHIQIDLRVYHPPVCITALLLFHLLSIQRVIIPAVCIISLTCHINII